MVKKLSVSFIWHMHQPGYKDENSGLYLMPWVRLHAVKDYLDMLLLLREFPNIKQTFNLVPLLLDQIEDYANNNAHDLHSNYTVRDIKTFTDEDKEFVFSNFFAANYQTQISINERYLELYNKYFNEQKNINDFSEQDISDLMALFNLAWIDPLHIENNPDIAKLVNKRANYTLDDRIKIIDIHRDIMRKIIPAYKEQLKNGKIEISTSPYYHTLVPLLINRDAAKSLDKNIMMPEIQCSLKQFAQIQIERSIEKIKDTFGQVPKGMWLPELCINNDSLKMLLNYDFFWTVADETVLSKTLKKDITRNYRGIIDDPFDLCISHAYRHNNKEINIVFRNAMLSNLIGFEYANYNPVQAANDLYERLKVAQDKLEISPIDNHIVTIAIDGENCWENYESDGLPFLRSLYTLLNNDNSIDVTTVSEYLQNIKIKQLFNSIQAGSWINANFDMWIGEPTKNMAWDYLAKTKEDFANAIKNNSYVEEVIARANKEISIAQGSDWFWWYGEPNNSGKDEIFDYLFRMHLQNVYKILNISVPEYLNTPLETFIGKPSKRPKGLISPNIGVKDKNAWKNAGCIEIPQSPTMATKLFDKICFGNNADNLYFRFDFNKSFKERNFEHQYYLNELFIYVSKKSAECYSGIRLRNKNDSIPQILKYPYTHEIQVPIVKEHILPIVFSEAIDNSLWKVIYSHNINYYHSSELELQIPFDDLKVNSGEGIYLTFITCKWDIINQVIPLDNSIYIERP